MVTWGLTGSLCKPAPLSLLVLSVLGMGLQQRGARPLVGPSLPMQSERRAGARSPLLTAGLTEAISSGHWGRTQETLVWVDHPGGGNVALLMVKGLAFTARNT